MQPSPQTPPPLRCTKCGALNDPFASQCHVCNARGAFGPPAYEEPVSPPPVGRSPLSPAAIARWTLAFGAVLIGARVLLSLVKASASHTIAVQPLVLPTITPTSATTTLAFAAQLPPARHFAMTADGRALAFVEDHLHTYTSAGVASDLVEAADALAPRADSPIAVVADSAYWIAAGGADIAGVRIASTGTPSVIVKRAQVIGGLGADEKSVWYTAADGKSGRKLMRVDVTASKVTPVQVATWSSARTSEPFTVTETDVFVVQPEGADAVRVVRVPKVGGHASTLVTLPAQEEIGTLAATTDTLYFTSGARNDTPRDLYRVPLAGGDRTKVLSSKGGVGDIAIVASDVVVADRPNTQWEIDSLPGGDVAQITIVASDVGRPPRLRAWPSHVVWSTSDGISFADL